MRLYVIMKDGEPFELPVEAGTETEYRLMDYDNGVGATFAFASTNLAHVRAMKKAIPELLDADDDMGLEIHSLTITPSMWTRME
jgi:hypothetical protein